MSIVAVVGLSSFYIIKIKNIVFFAKNAIFFDKTVARRYVFSNSMGVLAILTHEVEDYFDARV
jgi:hypothetical protein